MAITLIRNADWVIGWDEALRSQVYLRGADVAFEGGTLLHVGRNYAGPADITLAGEHRMVMPGLVNVHSHLGHEPAFRGIREEHGVPAHYMTGLFERSQAYGAVDAETRAASAEFACCELLRCGVTSVLDIGPPWAGWADLMSRSGLRGFLAPGFASARWTMAHDGSLGYVWDEAGGRKRFEAALELIDSLARHPCGRLSGVVAPMQIDTCSEGLLRDSLAAAKQRGIPMTVHIAQGVNEVLEMLRRHGRTPIRWAADIGILGPETILGHAIFTDGHSWVRGATSLTTQDDVALMARHGCTVAHCPTPFARYGHMLESFGGYLEAGVKMAIGTDTTPHNMLEEMRKASSLARIAARHIHSVALSDFFHAATVGGGRALQRPDLGRLARGAKADLVVVDLECPDMLPVRDPLRSLVFHAADRAVHDVWVDGQQVVAAGKVLTLDQAAAGARLAEAQARLMAGVPRRDYLGRSADQISPLSLKLR